MRRVSAAILFAGLLWAPAARAFCRETTVSPDPTFQPTTSVPCWTEGLPVYWKNACIGYWVQQNASKQVTVAQAKQIMDAAFAAWTSATCPGGRPSIAVDNEGEVICHKVELNDAGGGNANILMFDDGAWPHPATAGDTLALTTITYGLSTGELYDVDIEVNTHDNKFPLDGTDPDLQAVLTHEAGHFLGLAHTTKPQATMFPQYAGIAMRTLGADDVAGICSIYAADGTRSVADGGTVNQGSCDTTPHGGFASECDAKPTGCACSITGDNTYRAPIAITGTLLILWRWRRRRIT